MAMGALEVVTLRMICTRYLEKQVYPALKELQQAQESVNEQLASLKAAVAQQGGDGGYDIGHSGGPGGSKGLDMASLEKQMKEFRERLDVKADSKSVPSKAEFLELSDKVGGEAEADAEAKNAQLERKVVELERKIKDLTSKMHLKPDAQDVPLVSQLDEIAAAVQQKANARELQKLAETVKRQANSSKVPTLAQLEKLEAAVAGKIDANLCPTVHQVDELAAEMKRKANTNSVVTREQFQTLSAEVKQKAGAGDVVTSSLVEEVVSKKLSDAVANKADAGDVPTLAQHKELAAVTERKLAFLAAKVQQQQHRSSQQWHQNQPTIWCVPQVVDGCWEEPRSD